MRGAARGPRETPDPDAPRLGNGRAPLMVAVDANARPPVPGMREARGPCGPTYYFCYYLTLFARGYINALPKPHPQKNSWQKEQTDEQYSFYIC